MGGILLVEDDIAYAEVVAATLGPALGAAVHVAATAADAMLRLAVPGFAAAVVDRHLPDGDGLDLLRRLRAAGSDVPVVVLTADASAESAVEAMRAGAWDYLVKDRSSPERIVRVISALARPGPQDEPRRGADALLGASPAMQRLRAAVRCCARSAACILVEGETGVGKELVARALHAESARGEAPWVAVNCGALPEQLVESELFGHVRGAFTGAIRDHPGLVAAAARGTLFLDEVEDLPPGPQSKLLRLLQEAEYRPVGSTRVRLADVRVVAAANVDLARLVAERRFRRDLYYRLNVLRIVVPPLRERAEDIARLIHHFQRRALGRTERAAGGRPRGVAPDLAVAPPPPAELARLEEYPWPGNVRELANTVERAVVFVATNGWEAGWRAAVAQLGDLSPEPDPVDVGVPGWAVPAPTRGGWPASAERPPVAPEAAALRRVLERHRWRREAAARELGISRVTLWRRMRRFGLDVDPSADNDE